MLLTWIRNHLQILYHHWQLPAFFYIHIFSANIAANYYNHLLTCLALYSPFCGSELRPPASIQQPAFDYKPGTASPANYNLQATVWGGMASLTSWRFESLLKFLWDWVTAIHKQNNFLDLIYVVVIALACFPHVGQEVGRFCQVFRYSLIFYHQTITF